MENKQDSINRDVVCSILSKLPLKPRSRFKCVSKAWNSWITHLRRTSPLTTASGLVFSSKNRLTLLDVKDQCRSCSIHTSIAHDDFHNYLIDSCNGLLLFAAKANDGCNLTYNVFSPMNNQRLQLIPCTHLSTRHVSASLAFDMNLQQPHNFKVIFQFWDEADIKNGTIKYNIFRSKTGECRECSARIPKSSALFLNNKNFKSEEWTCPSLYNKGKVYWIWSSCLLVFDEENKEEESFELMELPTVSKVHMDVMSVYCSKRLWESEDRLRYCESTYAGFFIWDYIVDDMLRWRIKHWIRFDELVSKNCEVFDKVPRFSLSTITVKPCAFNEDLEILYFQLDGKIAGYSFETKKLVKVHSDSAIGGNINDNIYPFVFRAVDLNRLDTCAWLRNVLSLGNPET